ncbi:unnamed protein product [Arabidopsis halleri]
MTVVSKLLLLFQEDLSKLKIVKVTIETTFKGLASGGIGEHVERKDIIKSGVSECTRFLYLKGNLCWGEEDLTPMSLEEICNQNMQRLLMQREI